MIDPKNRSDKQICDSCAWFVLIETNAGYNSENDVVMRPIKGPDGEMIFRKVNVPVTKVRPIDGTGTCHYNFPSVGSQMGPRSGGFPTVKMSDFCRYHEFAV